MKKATENQINKLIQDLKYYNVIIKDDALEISDRTGLIITVKIDDPEIMEKAVDDAWYAYMQIYESNKMSRMYGLPESKEDIPAYGDPWSDYNPLYTISLIIGNWVEWRDMYV